MRDLLHNLLVQAILLILQVQEVQVHLGSHPVQVHQALLLFP